LCSVRDQDGSQCLSLLVQEFQCFAPQVLRKRHEASRGNPSLPWGAGLGHKLRWKRNLTTDAAVVCFDAPAMSVRSLGNALTSMGNGVGIQIALTIPIRIFIQQLMISSFDSVCQLIVML
jgi:hypothetical protein